MVAEIAHLTVLVDDRCAARSARRAVMAAAGLWGIDEDVSASLAVVVSELVTNAVSHGRSDASVTMTHEAGWVRLEVADEDSRLPVVAAADLASLGGRGLLLIAGLVTTWGAERTPTGKTVWAEVDCPTLLATAPAREPSPGRGAAR